MKRINWLETILYTVTGILSAAILLIFSGLGVLVQVAIMMLRGEL